MGTLDDLKDLEYRAEFERQQFELYEARRVAEETHANAVVVAAILLTGLVLADYARKSDPDGLVAALVGALLLLLWAFVLATAARVVSWETPPWLGGPYPKDWKPRAESVSGVLRKIAWVVFRMRPPWHRDKEGSAEGSADEDRPDARVEVTLDAVRDFRGRNHACIRSRVAEHWYERQQSAWKLGDRKEAHLRRSLWGFLGPAIYFAVRLLN